MKQHNFFVCKMLGLWKEKKNYHCLRETYTVRLFIRPCVSLVLPRVSKCRRPNLREVVARLVFAKSYLATSGESVGKEELPLPLILCVLCTENIQSKELLALNFHSQVSGQLQGVIFNCPPPPNSLSTKSLCILWLLGKFQSS